MNTLTDAELAKAHKFVIKYRNLYTFLTLHKRLEKRFKRSLPLSVVIEATIYDAKSVDNL